MKSRESATYAIQRFAYILGSLSGRRSLNSVRDIHDFFASGSADSRAAPFFACIANRMDAQERVNTTHAVYGTLRACPHK